MATASAWKHDVMHNLNKKTNDPQHPIDRRVESRRRWARYPVAGASVTVKSDFSTFEATALDESIGGIGLQTKSSVALVPGQTVELVHRDTEIIGQVAGVFPDAQGGCRLSICWDGNESKTADNQAEARPFFQFRGVTIICEIVDRPPASTDPEAPCKIQLWDGTSFDVLAKQIVPRTRNARCTEILTMGPVRPILTQLYALDPPATSTAEVEDILNFEFASRCVEV